MTANPNFEAKPGYSFTVVATDAAGNASEQVVRLAIHNVYEAASAIMVDVVSSEDGRVIAVFDGGRLIVDSTQLAYVALNLLVEAMPDAPAVAAAVTPVAPQVEAPQIQVPLIQAAPVTQSASNPTAVISATVSTAPSQAQSASAGLTSAAETTSVPSRPQEPASPSAAGPLPSAAPAPSTDGGAVETVPEAGTERGTPDATSDAPASLADVVTAQLGDVDAEAGNPSEVPRRLGTVLQMMADLYARIRSRAVGAPPDSASPLNTGADLQAQRLPGAEKAGEARAGGGDPGVPGGPSA